MSQFYAKWRDGFEVVWRNLTWSEYKKFAPRYENSPFAEPIDVALDIYKQVLIEGPDPAFVPAGIPAYICKQQMINNPFSGRYEDVANAVELSRRAVVGDYLQSAKALIANALHYKLEEIDQWDPNKFFLRLAQAEIALGRTFDPVKPKRHRGQAPIDDPEVQKILKKKLTPSQALALERTARERAGG